MVPPLQQVIYNIPAKNSDSKRRVSFYLSKNEPNDQPASSVKAPLFSFLHAVWLPGQNSAQKISSRVDHLPVKHLGVLFRNFDFSPANMHML